VIPAVISHIRHTETPYDELLARASRSESEDNLTLSGQGKRFRGNPLDGYPSR
jgi:hypothetical protein